MGERKTAKKAKEPRDPVEETDEDLIRALEEDALAFSLDGDDGRSDP